MPKRKRQRITVELLDVPTRSASGSRASSSDTASSASVSPVRHEGVFCDGCADSESDAPVILGVRWTRLDKDYDLCGACYGELSAKQQRRYEALTTAVAAPPLEADDDSGREEDDDEGEDGE